MIGSKHKYNGNEKWQIIDFSSKFMFRKVNLASKVCLLYSSNKFYLELRKFYHNKILGLPAG